MVTVGHVAAAPRPEIPYGGTVASVEIRTELPLSPEEVWELVPIDVGDRLTPAATRRSIRNLQSLGVAGEVEVFVEEGPDGLEVALAMWPRQWVESVSLEGELGIRERTLRGAIEQRDREALVADRVVRSVYALQDLYHERGFDQATVRVRVEPGGDPDAVRVAFNVDAGTRSTVDEIWFAGEIEPFTPEQLMRPLQVKPGNYLNRPVIREDAYRLQDWLIARGYRTASVGAAEETLDFEAASAKLEYPVALGSRVEVAVEGPDARLVDPAAVVGWLGPEGYDEALVAQAVQRAVNDLQSRGYYNAEVGWREEALADGTRLLLDIDAGERYALRSIRFVGDESATPEELLPLMATTPRRILARGSGRLVDEVLGLDLRNLRSYYALKGYSGAVVGPPLVEEDGSDLTLTIPIEPGARATVGELELQGVETGNREAILAEIPLEAGGPWHPVLLEESESAIRAWYKRQGYQGVRVWSEGTPRDSEAAAGQVDVRLRVLEGDRVIVDRVIVRGNRQTDDEIIRRTLGLTAGEPVSTGDLLAAQSRLYRFGIFSSARVELGPMDPLSPRRDVIVTVDEAPPQRVTYGAGFDSEDGVRGVFGYTNSNLFGRAFAVRADLSISVENHQARLLLRQPFVGNWDVPLTYNLFDIEESHDSFHSLRRGAQFELARFFRGTRTGLLYTYKFTELDDLDGALEDIDREFRDIDLSSLTPNILVDRRDDPRNPTRGWSSYLEGEGAFQFLSARTEFLRGFVQQTGYTTFGRFGGVAASLRLGTIEPSSSNPVDPTVPEALPSALTPIAERYFAGGRTSHRAYKRDRLGIPGETLLIDVDEDGVETGRLIPIGGNGLFLINFDYIFPITESISAVAFVDTGNVWADWRDINAAELKYGAGTGIRYKTPVGPLRVEIGWKLDREPSEDPYVIQLSFGAPF